MTSPDRTIYGPHAIKLSRPTRVFFGFLAVMGVAGFGFGIADRLSDRDAARSDRLRACSSTLSVELVSGPQAVALKALADGGLDAPEFKAATDKLQPVRFQKLTRLALADSTAFLEECERIVSASSGGKAEPFDSCAAAEAAGSAPLRSSDPGYNPELDADADGLACE